MADPRLPVVDGHISIIAGTRTIETAVAAIDRRMIVVRRPADPVDAKTVVLRWNDPVDRRAVQAEAMPTAAGSNGFLSLALIEAPRHERRAHRRHPAPKGTIVEARRLSADGKPGPLMRGPLLDVSAGGLAFSVGTPLEPGTRVEITVRSSASGAYIRSRVCAVASVREQGGKFIVGCDLREHAAGERGLAALVEDALLEHRAA